MTGRVERRDDAPLREACSRGGSRNGSSTPTSGFDEEHLFEFLTHGCLWTKTKGYGDHEPQHTIWKLAE